ncbi:MAG: VOC family protein [Cyanobacteria bacterium P01_A01_bin.114]
MITEARYVIAVPNLETSARFYRDILGFSIQEIGDPGWRFFVKDNCCIMAGECPDAIPPEELGDHSYFAYLTVEGIEDYFETVQQKGATILKPLRDEPWGMREFAIRTIDGHRIMFGYDYEQ